MVPEHKFATAARLCSEVLSGFAEGKLPLDAAAEVLRDALHILASKDIKVRCLFLFPHQQPALLHQSVTSYHAASSGLQAPTVLARQAFPVSNLHGLAQNVILLQHRTSRPGQSY